MENYSLHGAARPKVNTRSLDGSRKSGGAMPSNSKSGGAKAPPAPPSVHMYSMPYYTYGSTANFLLLGPTALIIYKTEKTF